MRIDTKAAEQTAGPRRQAEELLLQVYKRGYKDGEAAERERSEARQTAQWLQDAQAEFVYICSGCGCIKIGPRGSEYLWKYCSNCGARMISGGEEEA